MTDGDNANWGRPSVLHARARSLDDIMRAVFSRLLSKRADTFRVSSRKGISTEVFGALLELTDPRARLSRSLGRARIFSPIGELMWYLSGSNSLEFIKYYIPHYDEFSDDGTTLNGAYGPRIFSSERLLIDNLPKDEWQRTIDTLKQRNGTRNAIIQIFSNSDAARNSKDIPCTCTLQFVLRNQRVHLHVHMRSNDAFLGLPHDIFSFTMLQELAARELGSGLGHYFHSVASLHLYDDNDQISARTKAQQYLDEGLHEIVSMPAMPIGPPWPAIRHILAAEKEIRQGDHDYRISQALDPYWADLLRLMKAYAVDKARIATPGLEDLLTDIVHPVYRLYLLDRLARRQRSNFRAPSLFEDPNDAGKP
ncbi:thymidylate synthase [Bradyrhizobium oligotrophicum]|uniref:thymidylate synthase n=1 Tax=Bradyrhizobium oligotrophicum TaxID=44255 RepID=UPI003EBDDD03